MHIKTHGQAAINLPRNKTKACLVVEVQLIRTAATEILLPVASREFEILANLRVAIGSEADDRNLSHRSPGNLCVTFARQSRLSELALWAAVALCSFLVAQLFEDRG